MKKVLMIRFACILIVVLVINSGIAYFVSANQLLNSNVERLGNIANLVDYAIDVDDLMQTELERIQMQLEGQLIRITIIDAMGVVLADTDVRKGGLENHGNREEVMEAFLMGSGYATRYSETLQKDMLYVAKYSDEKDVVIRIAVEHTGLVTYIRLFFPMFLGSVVISLLISLIVATRYTDSITKPLKRIASLMKEVPENQFHFEPCNYQYEELNIISNTTIRLTSSIQQYVKKRELEKRIRQEFFSNASHELKTPITSIKGYAELIHSGMITDEKTFRDFIERILIETDHMTTLINDILMISRLESNEVEVTTTKIRMNLVVNDILETLKPQAISQEVTIQCECEPITIQGNLKQMTELLSNLISNGIKYNKQGGTVWVVLYQHGNHMHIQVRDNGMGISDEDQKRIFERFYCVDKGRSKKMGGTGLGLAIVKHIVEYNQGKIELKSEVGKGSRFEIILPIV